MCTQPSIGIAAKHISILSYGAEIFSYAFWSGHTVYLLPFLV